jgi:hypothetical protein
MTTRGLQELMGQYGQEYGLMTAGALSEGLTRMNEGDIL